MVCTSMSALGRLLPYVATEARAIFGQEPCFTKAGRVVGCGIVTSDGG